MPNAAIKASAYSLNHTPELGLWYGNTPYEERAAHPDSEFLKNLPAHLQKYDMASRYARVGPRITLSSR